MESKNMHPEFTVSSTPTSLHVRGKPIAGAEDRQRRISGFEQEVFSSSSVVCIGAGGLISHIAPTVVRKGVGTIALFDDDLVEPSNLNRQRFYEKDLGQNKAIALARNLEKECIAETRIYGHSYRLEEALASGFDLRCDVAICGVDNNPARVAASRHFRALGVPVIFAAVSRDGDHGYVFVQDRTGPCLGCLFPDMADDDRYPCPGTPAIADILQAVGAFAVYALDTLLMARPRAWNYRRIHLADRTLDGASLVAVRQSCPMCEGACS
jgi:molybdopterin/thiamine biosynthesis adenylyltransferase